MLAATAPAQAGAVVRVGRAARAAAATPAAEGALVLVREHETRQRQDQGAEENDEGEDRPCPPEARTSGPALPGNEELRL
jgi:hypothetical protein